MVDFTTRGISPSQAALPPCTAYPVRLKRPPHHRYRWQHDEKASPAPTGPVHSSRLENSRRWRGPTTRTSRAEGEKSSTPGNHSTGPSAQGDGLAWIPTQKKGRSQLNRKQLYRLNFLFNRLFSCSL